MARMHCRSKGVSESTFPYNTTKAPWVKFTKEECINCIIGLSKKGYKPSEIGKIMRDEYGIGRVKVVAGKNILAVLRDNDQVPSIPEDLEALVNKCESIKKHLDEFKNDIRAKYNLKLIESRLHRLARYFKRTGVLEKSWKLYSNKK